MSILIIVPLVALAAIVPLLVKGLPARRVVFIWLWAIAVLIFGGGLGFLLGDVNTYYSAANVRRLIKEADARLQANECDLVKDAFRKAMVHQQSSNRDSGLQVAITELRADKP